MTSISQTNNGTSRCAVCRKPLKPEEGYPIAAAPARPSRGAREAAREPPGDLLCASCAMEQRSVRGRKTHWQYIKSIKTEYLRPGKSDSS